MITEKDLQEAIAECQGQRNPNASTCIKLASYYTIKRELFGDDKPIESYSYAPEPSYTSLVDYHGESEFSQSVDGKDQSLVWPVIDELMSVVRALHPKLYNGVLDKLIDL